MVDGTLPKQGTDVLKHGSRPVSRGIFPQETGFFVASPCSDEHGIMGEMIAKTITTLEELSVIAHEVLNLCTQKEHARVIALSGDLGAGKTAFVKVIAKHLGVVEEITSPTFVVMKSYAIEGFPPITSLTHIDAYRIESDDEMRVLGFQELLADAGRIICIEWPEKIEKLIPDDAVRVQLELHSNETRTITYGS